MSPYSIFWRGQRPLYTEYTFDPFDIHSIGWYGWKGLNLSFIKRIENRLNIKKVMIVMFIECFVHFF